MALIGCNGAAAPSPPLKYIRKYRPPTQEIALFFHSNTRTSIADVKNKI